MILTTARLTLRPWCDDDAPMLYHYAKDPAIGPIAGWPPHQSVEESLDIIRTVFSAPETYAICLRDTGEPIGCIGLQQGDAANVPLASGEAELGYWVGKSQWGKGYTPEAARALIAHAFNNLGFTTLWCTCNSINTQSKRVMEKCGFTIIRSDEKPLFSQDTDGWTFTGETRTDLVARLTCKEWENESSESIL